MGLLVSDMTLQELFMSNITLQEQRKWIYDGAIDQAVVCMYAASEATSPVEGSYPDLEGMQRMLLKAKNKLNECERFLDIAAFHKSLT